MTANNDASAEPWYAVRTIYQHSEQGLYEERIVLVRASDDQEANAKAQAEGEEYAKNVGVEKMKFAEVYHISEDPVQEDTEIFSWMRRSKLSPDEYIDRFYKTGEEVVGEEHSA